MKGNDGKFVIIDFDGLVVKMRNDGVEVYDGELDDRVGYEVDVTKTEDCMLYEVNKGLDTNLFRIPVLSLTFDIFTATCLDKSIEYCPTVELRMYNVGDTVVAEIGMGKLVVGTTTICCTNRSIICVV